MVTRFPLLQEARLLYGMLFSLKSFSNRISPLDVQEGVQCYTTNKYKMTLYETPTSLKFVCNTDVNAPGVNELLQKLYTQASHPCHVSVSCGCF